MSATTPRESQKAAVIGCLFGTAVGLACEGLPKRRQARLFPSLDDPRLLGHHGMVSDDTEHTCLVAQALVETEEEPEAFPRAFARRLCVWLLGLPAGAGWATLTRTPLPPLWALLSALVSAPRASLRTGRLRSGNDRARETG